MSYLASKLTMDEEVVYGLLALLAKTTPINQRKAPPPKVIDRKYFTQSFCSSEESNMRWSLHLPNALPRKKGRLTILRNHFFFFLFHSIFYGEYVN
jgi:hypothetical protein